MLDLRRPPPALLPYVECLWASDGLDGDETPRAARERALPTGSASLAFRLDDAPIRVFASLAQETPSAFGFAAVSGMRSTFHVRDTARPSRSIGVHFRPGGAAALLGVPADLLAERHVALVDLWGRAADELRERLVEARSPEARLELVELELLTRGAGARALPAAVAHALARFDADPSASVGALCQEIGLSPRRMIEVFRRSVGLTPKVYCRIRRFRRALRLAARPGRVLADVAQASGYHDQAHMSREFQAFAGLAPGAYRPASAARLHHVPVSEAGGSNPYKPCARARP